MTSEAVVVCARGLTPSPVPPPWSRRRGRRSPDVRRASPTSAPGRAPSSGSALVAALDLVDPVWARNFVVVGSGGRVFAAPACW